MSITNTNIRDPFCSFDLFTLRVLLACSTCCGRARPSVWERAWCTPGRGTTALWLAARWACRRDIWVGKLRTVCRRMTSQKTNKHFNGSSFSATRIHPVKQHHETRLGVEGKGDAPQVSDQTHQCSLPIGKKHTQWLSSVVINGPLFRRRLSKFINTLVTVRGGLSLHQRSSAHNVA